MSPKYTILFFPADGVGHFNASFGLGCALRDRGHNVVFAAPLKWKGKLSSQGFGEALYAMSEEDTTEEVVGVKWGEMIAKFAPVFSMPPPETHEHFYLPMFNEMAKLMKYAHPQLKEIMATVKPDVVVADNFTHLPALYDSGVPWILQVSLTPLAIAPSSAPPPFMGFPTESDPSTWTTALQKMDTVYTELRIDMQQWITDNGGPEIPFKFPFMQNFSPYANIYMYPLELDYSAHWTLPENFHRFDTLIRTTNDTFQIPDQVKSGNGKLIYFSMGTMGCVEINLMKRLLGILSKSPNRFIVSKGPLGDELELAENMWGGNYLPQTKIIPLVDLVITHGGNNTVAESFYFGKKVLVLPLLFDQPDNAQRIFETGHGLSFHPYKVTGTELLCAIETLLTDKMLERRMASISKRIQASNSEARAADLVEDVARKHRRGE